MAELRLYREIYKIQHTVNSEVYSLINPTSLTAAVYNLTDNSIVEIPSITNTSIGVYFASMNPVLYSYDNIYELQWTVKYVTASPNKILKTRFKFQPNVIVMDYKGQILIEKAKDFEYEVKAIDEIEIIVNTHS